MKKIESLIETYKDFPKKGIAFKDILGIIQDTEVFKELILEMSSSNVIKNSEAINSLELMMRDVMPRGLSADVTAVPLEATG